MNKRENVISLPAWARQVEIQQGGIMNASKITLNQTLTEKQVEILREMFLKSYLAKEIKNQIKAILTKQ